MNAIILDLQPWIVQHEDHANFSDLGVDRIKCCWELPQITVEMRHGLGGSHLPFNGCHTPWSPAGEFSISQQGWRFALESHWFWLFGLLQTRWCIQRHCGQCILCGFNIFQQKTNFKVMSLRKSMLQRRRSFLNWRKTKRLQKGLFDLLHEDCSNQGSRRFREILFLIQSRGSV